MIIKSKRFVDFKSKKKAAGKAWIQVFRQSTCGGHSGPEDRRKGEVLLLWVLNKKEIQGFK